MLEYPLRESYRGMRKVLSIFFLVLTCVLPIKFGVMMTACGSTSVQLENSDTGSQDTGTTCAGPATDVDTGTVTTAIAGDACYTPVPTVLEADTNSVLLDCEPDLTASSTSDFVTVTCGNASADFFCDTGIVVYDDGDTGTDITSSPAQVQVQCTTDGNADATLTAVEFQIS